MSQDSLGVLFQPLQADDHDSEWSAVLVPFGILNTATDQLSIYFGQSAETSDFIVDCLIHWWQDHQAQYHHLEQLTIDLDGGSATRSDSTQFIKRMVEFAQTTRLKIRLVYYSPCHSKYNPVERCWAALENYWNGTVLDSIETGLQWAVYMSWRGIAPVVHLLDSLYQKGIKVPLPELQQSCLPFWQRSETLPKWYITPRPI